MKTIEILDVCHPDYFTGYHRPVLAVPVFNNMTFDELAEGIEQDLNYSWDHLTNSENGFTKTEVLIIEEYINALRTKQVYKDSGAFIGEEFEEFEEDTELPYCYMSICKINTKHSITFLDH